MFDCHCWTPMFPRLRELVPPVQVVAGGFGTQPTFAGVDRPSMIWSFHWSPMVSLQLPPGTFVNLKFPLTSHLVNMKSSASGSPKLTQHCVQARASREPLGYSLWSGVRLWRCTSTCPWMVLLQGPTAPYEPLQTASWRELMMVGLAKPM